MDQTSVNKSMSIKEDLDNKSPMTIKGANKEEENMSINQSTHC